MIIELQNTDFNLTISTLEKFNLLCFIKDNKGVYVWLCTQLIQHYNDGSAPLQVIGYTDESMPWKNHIAYINSTDISCNENTECLLYEFNLHKENSINLKLPWKSRDAKKGVIGICCRTQDNLLKQEVSNIIRSYTHDLRLPINSILGNIQLCKYLLHKGDTSQAITMLDQANRGVIAMVNTLDHFKNISKAQNKKFMVFPMVQYEVDMAQALIGPNQFVDIFYNISSAVPMEMSCNLYPIQQIVRNLLSNAVKFTLHGSITLKLNVKSQNTLPHTHWNSIDLSNNMILIITISDTGIGLPASIMQSLDLLYKCSARNINNNSGLEIIAKHLKSMNGYIEYNSTQQGSTFECYIPIS